MIIAIIILDSPFLFHFSSPFVGVIIMFLFFFQPISVFLFYFLFPKLEMVGQEYVENTRRARSCLT